MQRRRVTSGACVQAHVRALIGDPQSLFEQVALASRWKLPKAPAENKSGTSHPSQPHSFTCHIIQSFVLGGFESEDSKWISSCSFALQKSVEISSDLSH